MEDSDYPAIAQAEKISEYTTCDDALTKFISNVGVEGSIDVVRLTNITGQQPTQPQEDPTEQQSEPATEPVTQTETTTDASSPTQAQETSSAELNGQETQSAGKGTAATGDQTAVFLPLLALIGAAAAVVVLKRREKV